MFGLDKLNLIRYIMNTTKTQRRSKMSYDEIKEKIDRLEKSGANRVSAEIHFKDDDSSFTSTIALSSDYREDDEEVFFYCKSIRDLIGLFDKDNCEDFYITDIYP